MSSPSEIIFLVQFDDRVPECNINIGVLSSARFLLNIPFQDSDKVTTVLDTGIWYWWRRCVSIVRLEFRDNRGVGVVGVVGVLKPENNIKE